VVLTIIAVAAYLRHNSSDRTVYTRMSEEIEQHYGIEVKSERFKRNKVILTESSVGLARGRAHAVRRRREVRQAQSNP